jgi:hypothetical protein
MSAFNQYLDLSLFLLFGKKFVLLYLISPEECRVSPSNSNKTTRISNVAHLSSTNTNKSGLEI